MSRCFPYPPPGYEKNGVRDEALILSIKLQRGREKARKERRKEKKSEKKENLWEDGETEKKKPSHENRHKEGRKKVDQKGRDHQKRRQNETEHLEKSGLTEEQGQPVRPQSLYDSSDSTQNSNKRKKHSSPSNGSHNHGSVIRIRLPQQKHKDSEVLPSIEQPCSTSRTSIVVQEKYEIAPRPSKKQSCSTSGRTKIVAQEIAPRPGKEQACSTSGSTEIIAQAKAETAPTSSLFGSGSLQIESQVRELIESWVPPAIQVDRTDFDDQEWLFETKQHHKQGNENFKASNDGLYYGCSTLWPHACYLPEADIYALPFTVPF